MSKALHYVIGELLIIYNQLFMFADGPEHMEEDDEGTKALPEWVKLE